ncbi:Hypothetical_protein [Hexamita inflata]|uniref:Hypothetical_protein n=1 Tax=Hexamita inflata TaxID=28002 RepID=A0ABP1IL39_9EUKA
MRSISLIHEVDRVKVEKTHYSDIHWLTNVQSFVQIHNRLYKYTNTKSFICAGVRVSRIQICLIASNNATPFRLYDSANACEHKSTRLKHTKIGTASLRLLLDGYT